MVFGLNFGGENLSIKQEYGRKDVVEELLSVLDRSHMQPTYKTKLQDVLFAYEKSAQTPQQLVEALVDAVVPDPKEKTSEKKRMNRYLSVVEGRGIEDMDGLTIEERGVAQLLKTLRKKFNITFKIKLV